LKINLRIEFVSGEEKEITCSASDMVKFESKFDLSVAVLEENVKLTHLLYLAYLSEFRTKSTVKEFDDWIDDVASIKASENNPK
jgi:hypothetical protein